MVMSVTLALFVLAKGGECFETREFGMSDLVYVTKKERPSKTSYTTEISLTIFKKLRKSFEYHFRALAADDDNPVINHLAL